MRDATGYHLNDVYLVIISIHASHAGRDVHVCDANLAEVISIHASHAGRDMVCGAICLGASFISIHASHAGRDPGTCALAHLPCYFNPRVPCGTRHGGVAIAYGSLISIHASHAGRDEGNTSGSKVAINFNPRVPCGTRLDVLYHQPFESYFNPRVPCGTRRQN